MPRVIQPGGGGGKMRVRYTERRKQGLVATPKNMMAEGMTLHAAASELRVTPPAEKLLQNPLRKTKPARHPPAVSAQTPTHTDWLSCCLRWLQGGSFDLDRPVVNEGDHFTPPPNEYCRFSLWFLLAIATSCLIDLYSASLLLVLMCTINTIPSSNATRHWTADVTLVYVPFMYITRKKWGRGSVSRWL